MQCCPFQKSLPPSMPRTIPPSSHSFIIHTSLHPHLQLPVVDSPCAPPGPPHVQRLGLCSSCRLRSRERFIRASSRSWLCRSRTGKTRDSVTELLPWTSHEDQAGGSITTTSPLTQHSTVSQHSTISLYLIRQIERDHSCLGTPPLQSHTHVDTKTLTQSISQHATVLTQVGD